MHNHDAAQFSPTLPAGLPEGWLFDRDLSCPECNYNLRMLSKPRCPECGTSFRWQTLLHVGCPRCGEGLEAVDDGQCPRCGLELNWEKLLGDADPALHRHFEYTTRPIRAIVPTWFAVLRPARFWKRIPLESPPAVKRLRRLRRLSFAICIAAIAACMAVNWLFYGDAGSMTIWGALFVLPIATTLALPLFVPTLARFRIRRDQLLRCLAYASTTLAWIGILLLLMAGTAAVINLAWPYNVTYTSAGTARTIAYPRIGVDLLHNVRDSFVAWRQFTENPTAAILNSALLLAVLYFTLAWWWRFLWVSLRRYLRLDRNNALALFLSTQVIGLLLVALVLASDPALLRLLGHFLNHVF